MPYYEESPFGAAADVFGGIAAGQQQQKDRALEQQRLQEEIAAQQANVAHQSFEEHRETQQDNITRGLQPNGTPYVSGAPPQPKNATDDQMFHWAIAASIAAQKQGNTTGANYYKGIADTYALGQYRIGEGAYAQAGVGLRQAETKNVEGLFAQQVKLAKIHTTAQEYAAGLRAARAGARARSGGSNQANAEYVSALRGISSEEMRMAVQTAVDEWSQYQTNRRATMDSQGNFTMPDRQLEMPQSTIINVQTPQGTVVPMLVPQGFTMPGQQPSSNKQSGGGGGHRYPTGTKATIGGKPVVMGADGQWHPARASQWQGFGPP